MIARIKTKKWGIEKAPLTSLKLVRIIQAVTLVELHLVPMVEAAQLKLQFQPHNDPERVWLIYQNLFSWQNKYH